MSRQFAKIGWVSAAALVVANMIGTGAFTSLGFQLAVVENSWSILSLWAIGGLMALFGALSYAELGTRLPRSGGEYHFISSTLHPLAGYLSGWVSLTVGFAAPVALAAMAMASYLERYVGLSPMWLAIAVVTLISLMHSIHLRHSERFQNIFTLLKLLVIFILIALSIFYVNDSNALDWSSGWKREIWLPAYAVSLVFVSYAYSGWNAAAYIVEEIRDVNRNLPRALIIGTVFVAVLYLLLQLAFLSSAPLEALVNEVEVGQVAASYMLGPVGAKAISIVIAVLLISSISAMIWVGPRVTKAMAEDYSLWSPLAKINRNGLPVRAIWLQWLLAAVLIVSGSFEKVLLYSGFVLQLFSMLAVIGMMRLRIKEPKFSGFRSPGFPYVQSIFLIFGAWVLIFMLIDRPFESMLGVINLLLGAITWMYSQRKSSFS